MSHHTRRTFLKVSGAALGGIAVGSTVTAATRTDRFIIKTNNLRKVSDAEIVHALPGIPYAVVEASDSDLQQSKAVTGFAPDIDIVLNDPDVNIDAPTLDDASEYEGPFDFFQWDKSVLAVPTAHETTEGEGTRVSVIDSGVLDIHPDLTGPLNLELSRNFTGDGGDHNPVAGNDHGTHVAGIIAADNGSGSGVNGTAPQTELVDCRVFSGLGASFGDIIAAIVYSVGIDADVANLSLGAYPVPRQGLGGFYGGVLNTVMTYANKEGTLLAVAAGNDGADLQHDQNLISLPNENAQALAVSATGPLGYGWDADGDGETSDFEAPPQTPAYYTNYGTNSITLGAPGGNADLSAIGSGVPWFWDLVFNTAFLHNGALVAGTFGPKTDAYPGSVTAEWTGSYDGAVAVSGRPPFTNDTVPWYASVGVGGVRFSVGNTAFTGDETVTVEYVTGADHERPAPDWIALDVTVPPATQGEEPTEYVVVDWQVSEGSGSTVSWDAADSFGDGPGGVFEAPSLEAIFADPAIDPTTPNGDRSDVLGGTITNVGVFSGGGIGRDETVDIVYTDIGFDDASLLIPQTPGWGWKAGTSMAAPNVAGAAALVKSANPRYSANQVEAALKRAAEVPAGFGKEYYGSGFLNILDAL